MRLFTSSTSKRLNEVTGFLLLAFGLLVLLGLASYHVTDPSWDTAAGPARAQNLTGAIGAYAADLLLQGFGAAAFLFPMLAFVLGWLWIRSENIEAPLIKVTGFVLLFLSVCTAAGLAPDLRLFEQTIPLGGATGAVAADMMRNSLNRAGSIIVTAVCFIISVYLVSTFSLDVLISWMQRPVALFRARQEANRKARAEKAAAKAAAAPLPVPAEKVDKRLRRPKTVTAETPPVLDELPPWEELDEQPEPVAMNLEPEEIPIRQLVEEQPVPAVPAPIVRRPAHPLYQLPSTTLLNEAPGRSAFDEQELKNTAAAVKSKFEEFNVLGSVVQINPGPVVTTFEFKPEAGIKYSRITNLNEDLCLGLQAESIMIERIPGKPTVGIEVPNTKREVIALRQILESEEFQSSPSHLTISMGKDINGRIKVASLETMPHALIAGSTGSGKSVMINSLIMSICTKRHPTMCA